jgi:hypothetical protein
MNRHLRCVEVMHVNHPLHKVIQTRRQVEIDDILFMLLPLRFWFLLCTSRKSVSHFPFKFHGGENVPRCAIEEQVETLRRNKNPRDDMQSAEVDYQAVD